MSTDDCPHCGCTPRTRQTARQWIGLDLPDDPGCEPVYRDETPRQRAVHVLACVVIIALYLVIIDAF